MNKICLSLLFLIGVWGCKQESSTSTQTNPNPPTSPKTCFQSSECDLGEYCDECAGGSSCPTCQDCIGLCVASSCETEAQAACEIEPPTCEYGSILIIQNECWSCVDQLTCEPTPEIQPSPEFPERTSCSTSNDCPAGSICNECAGSSCPACDDCISACQPICDSETEALCEIDPPTCEANQVRIIVNQCWECVSQATCEL